MDFNELLKNAIDLLIEKVNPFMVYLFGSASRAELREDSDIDIAYISDTNLTPYQNFLLAQELADIFKRDVDLINLREASTVFKAQVVGTGKKIYCTDETRRMYFEMSSFKEYAVLNEERDIIMRNIKKRGSVYGE
jgi:uncharacterized protein